MIRRAFREGARLLLASFSLLKPFVAITPMAAEPLAANSAYERLRRLRLAYMLVKGNPHLRYAINRQIIALAFEMRDCGASRQHIKTMSQKSLYFAKRDFLALQTRRTRPTVMGALCDFGL